MNSTNSTPNRLSLLLLISVLFVSGCSSSSDNTDSVASQTPVDGIDVPTTETDTTPDTTPDTETVLEESNTTLVNFDITVPAYMSNELQVRVESGDINTTAAFVRDESWSVSEDFPINTDNALLVTFADRNGAITLGTVDTRFSTSANSSQTVQITADQFNTERWDSDGDGVSNLDELIAGFDPEVANAPQPVQATLELIPDKTFRINWQPSANAEFYRVLENPDGISGFSSVSENLDIFTQSFNHRVALFNRVNARYIVQACNTIGCVDSESLIVSGTLDEAIGYFKSSNTDNADSFGGSISVSTDGSTLAVGAAKENSAATGINGNQDDNSAFAAGAVYVFARNNGLWQQQAYLKASNAGVNDRFGIHVSLSADGNTLAVGADEEDSAATGINGDQNDNSAIRSGAAYVFVRSGEVWELQAYIKASNTDAGDFFGGNVSLSASGNTLAVGARFEDSAATGINGDQADNSADNSGAVYVFARSQTMDTMDGTSGLWQQQAYLKATNADSLDLFGSSVFLSANGNTLAVSAQGENSAATGINGDQSNSAAPRSGAIYVFVRSNAIDTNNGTSSTGDLWQQQAYLKASNTEGDDTFGDSVSLSADGNTLAVGAIGEDSAALGINGDQNNDLPSSVNSGAVYVFIRSNTIDGTSELWQQRAYLKASNADRLDRFGGSVSLSANGNTLAIGARVEGSLATGINGDQIDSSAFESGAVYVFVRSNTTGGTSELWQQQVYLKASNSEGADEFGSSLSLSADGNTLAVGATWEDSGATGINGNQADNSVFNSGALYLY